MTDPRQRLVIYIRTRADGGDDEHRGRLHALADDLERLRDDHPLARSLDRMPESERFPNEGACQAVERYRSGLTTHAEDVYLDVLGSIDPGMDVLQRRLDARPVWATPTVSPLGWVLYGLFAGSRKKCPDCAERVKADARVCRFCGHQFS